jgi:hypothetical protein
MGDLEVTGENRGVQDRILGQRQESGDRSQEIQEKCDGGQDFKIKETGDKRLHGSRNERQIWDLKLQEHKIQETREGQGIKDWER